MSSRSSRIRVQPSISEACAEWIDTFADRWGVSRDVATAKILEAISESPWTDLTLKQPGTEISIEKMEVLIKRRIQESD
ncbi:hypothetical protein Lepto7375DRAFT_7400 [Leptolyngbya sp. PCC 7375]|nr:hypothetical protein Lepto7375DRAFT_7400 [Leptolyngbya sp. PCC 7375]